MEKVKLTISDIFRMKEEKRKITAVTAYDYPTALLADKAGIEIILVGDTCSMVVLGYDSTIPITMDEMIHHCKAVKRGVKRSLIVGDMPFMSFNVGKEDAIRNAGRFIKEGGCDAVKLEGGVVMRDTVKAIVDAGIPVMGHVGLTPQTATFFSGYKVRGKEAVEAMRIIRDAEALEDSGVFLIVLESITTEVTRMIADKVKVPLIGIGAGPDCDGQVLVLHDLLGLFDRFVPRFVKRYANLNEEILKALETYREEVQKGIFPADQHCYHMDKSEFEKLQESIKKK
ncbi:MAG: 3-methyl-2-oxobutanoate hydroxymethyltransferase [archaeon]|nr:3-methyl-2-oxobutanoate hydroxymethyltransferase [archaeon]MCP8306821.1 3-methyl-2-oxobutanoate hydroxymethyltransferase [archaeon]